MDIQCQKFNKLLENNLCKTLKVNTKASCSICWTTVSQKGKETGEMQAQERCWVYLQKYCVLHHPVLRAQRADALQGCCTQLPTLPGAWIILSIDSVSCFHTKVFNWNVAGSGWVSSAPCRGAGCAHNGCRICPAVLLPPAPLQCLSASGVMRAVWSQWAWLLLAAFLSSKQAKSALLLCSQGVAALRALQSQREVYWGNPWKSRNPQTVADTHHNNFLCWNDNNNKTQHKLPSASLGQFFCRFNWLQGLEYLGEGGLTLGGKYLRDVMAQSSMTCKQWCSETTCRPVWCPPVPKLRSSWPSIHTWAPLHSASFLLFQRGRKRELLFLVPL